MKSLLVIAWLSGMLMCAPLQAAIDAYPFPDDELRARYQSLIDELRCPQCLNTNLAGSDSMIAKDLRREVHRLLLEGNSDDEIRTFMQDRYGDFILYDPEVKAGTLALWLGPLFLLLMALAVGYRVVHQRRADNDLSAVEQARLDELLQGPPTKS